MHNVWGVSSMLGETQAFIEWVFEEHVYLLDYLPEPGSKAEPVEKHTHNAVCTFFKQACICDH